MSDAPEPKFHFRDWMDRRKLKASDVAPRFGITNQTVFNWRSNGVPESRQEFVARTIAEWPPVDGHPIIVTPTATQYAAWQRATSQRSIDTGLPMTLEEWAVEGLDQLAFEHFNDPQLKLKLRTNLDAATKTLLNRGIRPLDAPGEDDAPPLANGSK